MSEIKIGARVTLTGVVIAGDIRFPSKWKVRIENEDVPREEFFRPGAFLTVENPPEEPLKAGDATQGGWTITAIDEDGWAMIKHANGGRTIARLVDLARA